MDTGRGRKSPMNAEPANPIPHRRLHRAVFIAAGLYNIAWGIFAVLDPQWLFRFAGMPPLNHPQIFACLGMVVGLYGVVYIEVARRPERGWVSRGGGPCRKNLWSDRTPPTHRDGRCGRSPPL